MSIVFLAIWSLVAVAAFIVADRRAQHIENMKRYGRVVKGPQKRPPLELMEVPKFCPCCGRKMTEPIGLATEITPNGSRKISICSICLALGPMNSIISAAVEEKTSCNTVETRGSESAVERFVSRFFDPLILRCFGWRAEKWEHVAYGKVWRDPQTGYLWQQDAAVLICERRIHGG